jgi:protein-tyrosine phosphatase
MNWITDKIAIGSLFDAQDAEMLKREQIQVIFGLTSGLESFTPRDLNVERIVIEDLKDNDSNIPGEFVRIVGRLVRMAHTHSRILVHCQAGCSRSPAVVAGYLMKTEGLSPEEAVRRVAEKRDIKIHPGLVLLLDYLDE